MFKKSLLLCRLVLLAALLFHSSYSVRRRTRKPDIDSDIDSDSEFDHLRNPNSGRDSDTDTDLESDTEPHFFISDYLGPRSDSDTDTDSDFEDSDTDSEARSPGPLITAKSREKPNVPDVENARNKFATFIPVSLPSYNDSVVCITNSATCLHGVCREWKPGSWTCVCINGWKGEFCNEKVNMGSELPPSYKSLFSHLCDCNPCWHGGTCSVSKFKGYKCRCTDYRYGRNCELLCEYPDWGKSCKNKCYGCTERVCHLAKGCLVCDKPGWTRVPNCDFLDCLDVPCDNFGYCQEEKVPENVRHSGPHIPSVVMSCKCSSYYTGVLCEEGIAEKKYPLLCENEFERLCKNGATCRKEEESIIPFIGGATVCVCAPGFYGKYCDKACFSPHKADCDNGDCLMMPPMVLSLYQVNVQCVCWPGFKGRTCNQKCQNSWGKDCKNKCGKCAGNTSCHHVHGLCDKNRCAPDFFGIRCDKYRTIVSKLNSRIAHYFGFRINVNVISFTGFNVSRDSKEEDELPEALIEQLQVFIADSYDKYNMTVMEISDVIINEYREILSATTDHGRYIGKVQRSRVHGGTAKRVTSISKRDINTETFKQYDLNYTVIFAGRPKDINGRQLKSIFRKEAKNFKYSVGASVSIDPKSIKIRTKMVTRKLAENEKLINHKTLLISVSLAMLLAIIVAIAMLLRPVFRLKSTPKQRRAPARYPNYPSKTKRMRTNEPRTNGPWTNGPRTIRPLTIRPQTNGPRTIRPQTNWPHGIRTH